MYKYILLTLLFFISIPFTIEAQITVNSNGHVEFSEGLYTSLNSGSTYDKAIHGNVQNAGPFAYGIYGKVQNIGSSGYGVYGSVSNATYYGYGVYAFATATGSGTASRNVGVYARAQNASTYNYGIIASANGPNNYGGYFLNGIYVSGGITQASDERLKKNIRALNIEDVSAKIRQLKPQRYEYLNAGELKQRGLPVSHAEEGDHFGLLAQELEKVFPELVSDVVHALDESLDQEQRAGKEPETVTTKAINYQELTVVLLAAVQELQNKVEVLEAALNR